MKQYILTGIALSFGLTGTMAGTSAGKTPPPPPPASEPIGITLSAGFDSHYLFHGFNVGEELLWGRVEYGTNLSDKLSLTAGAWYGHLFDYDYDELDLYAGLTYDLGVVNAGVGFTWYHYIDGSAIDNQYEPYVMFSTDADALPLDFTFYYFYEFEVKGHYLELIASKTIPLTDSVSLVPSAVIAYNSDFNSLEDDFNHVGVRLSMPIALSSSATLTPYVGGNFPLEATDDIQNDIFTYGVSLAVKF